MRGKYASNRYYLSSKAGMIKVILVSFDRVRRTAFDYLSLVNFRCIIAMWWLIEVRWLNRRVSISVDANCQNPLRRWVRKRITTDGPKKIFDLKLSSRRASFTAYDLIITFSDA